MIRGQKMQCLLIRVRAHRFSCTVVVLHCFEKEVSFLCRAGKKKRGSVFDPPHPLSIACMFSHMGFGCIFLFLPLNPFVDQQSHSLLQTGR